MTATVPLAKAIGDAEAAGWTATPRKADVVFARPGGGGIRIDLCPGGIRRTDHQRLLARIASAPVEPSPLRGDEGDPSGVDDFDLVSNSRADALEARVRHHLSPWPHLVDQAAADARTAPVGGWLVVFPESGRVCVCAAAADLLWQVVRGGELVVVLDLKENP